MASQSYSDHITTQLFHKGTISMVKQLIYEIKTSLNTCNNQNII